MLSMFDQNQSGTLTAEEMQGVLVKSQMDKEVCRRVWDISNPQRDTTFTKSMFFVAMHLIYKKKQDANLELPD